VQDITIAAIQMNARLGEVERNLDSIERWARQAAAAGAELVCFPELCISGHWCAGEVWSVAEPVPEGPSCRRLGKLARELGIYLSVGLAELQAGIAYNTQVIIGPTGVIGKQRKLHMSADEYFHFRTGTRIPVLDIGKCRLGIGICYDNIFPEVARIAAVKGAEVYLMPHAARIGAWPQTTGEQQQVVATNKKLWAKVYAARAYDNGMYVVVCNQAGPAGEEPPTNHGGGIMVFDPAGELIAESRTRVIEEEMVVCRLQAELFAQRRKASCFNLQTRRPEIYGELTKPTD